MIANSKTTLHIRMGDKQSSFSLDSLRSMDSSSAEPSLTSNTTTSF